MSETFSDPMAHNHCPVQRARRRAWRFRALALPRSRDSEGRQDEKCGERDQAAGEQPRVAAEPFTQALCAKWFRGVAQGLVAALALQVFLQFPGAGVTLVRVELETTVHDGFQGGRNCRVQAP